MSKRKNEIEAIHLVALAIDAKRKEGTPEHAKAVALSEQAKSIWRKQFWSKRTCPHCGHTL